MPCWNATCTKREFKPEYAGKLNFYLSAVDDLLRHPQDNPTVGILLCKEKNRVVVEYALRDVSKPLGVAEYRLAQALPAELRGALPCWQNWTKKIWRSWGVAGGKAYQDC